MPVPHRRNPASGALYHEVMMLMDGSARHAVAS